MTFLDVISAGPGDAALLTPAALDALTAAELVFCSDRLQSLVPDPEKCRNLLPLQDTMTAIRSLLSEDRRPAVLVSGDAGLYSLMPRLAEQLGADRIRVIPGISSIQAFCARLKIPWQDARILSAHGRPLNPEALCYHVRTNRRTLLLLDQVNHPDRIHDMLTAGGLGDVRLIIGERITAEDEHISLYQPGQLYDALSLALIENDLAKPGLPPAGLPDDAFFRNKTPMTKREIRVQILSALALPMDARVWDIGAGTGGVTVECARQCPLGSVSAIEMDEDARSALMTNLARFHLQNVMVLEGTAPDILRDLPAPTHVFLGGTGGRTQQIWDCLSAFGTSVRVCATAVTMESADTFLRLFRTLSDYTAVQIAVSRIEPAGSYSMFRAQNPVFIFSGTIPGHSV